MPAIVPSTGAVTPASEPMNIHASLLRADDSAFCSACHSLYSVGVIASAHGNFAPQVQTRRLDWIWRLQEGHGFVSPHPAPTTTGTGGFCATAAFLQPYVPQPPISLQHDW